MMKNRLSYVREYAVFAMLGTIMFLSKILMEFLPNIHLMGVLTMVYTRVYRVKALIPIYISVLLNGIFFGFSLWWVPYLYIWAILWGAIILLPRNMPGRLAFFVYPIVTCLHGLLYGVLYSPAQALMFGLNLEATLAWIAAGFYFDLLHAAGNLVLSFNTHPLVPLLRRLSGDIAAPDTPNT